MCEFGMSEQEANNQKNNQKSQVSDAAEKYCLELIREFLASYGFENTASALHDECLQRGLPSTVPISTANSRRLVETFDAKHEAKFFRLWHTLVPPGLHQTMDYKKLTFYLHVHFAVLPMRVNPSSDATTPGNKTKPRDDFYIEINDGVETFVLIKEDGVVETEEEGGSDGRDTSFTLIDEEGTATETSVEDSPSPPTMKQRVGACGMERLRQYLKNAGSELSSEPDLLSYYALPLVSNPTAHPSFTELFKETWVTHVTQSFHGFLAAHTPAANVNSKPPRLLQMIRSESRQLNKRFQRLHRDHHHLIGLASELTSALERSVQGHAVDLKVTLDKCARVYPELFAPRSAKPQTFDLDYRKIKQHLVMASAKVRLLLLQALRWRVTRSAASERGLILHHYARHDLLGLHDSPSHLLATLLFQDAALTPHPLQQCAARLVNTLASLRSGRDYLSDVRLLDVLVPCLMQHRGVKIDGYTSDMLLASLQKLSLRHKLRVGMISAGLVEWLIARLALKNISTYTLEYGCALLMNLCLHEEAKLRCVPLAEQVLKLLARHLGARLPYVNGTLYSLLADKRINAEAKRLGLASVLEYHLKNSDGEMRKQFEYILKLHHTGSTTLVEQNTNDDENDDTEEMDLLEEELDAADPVPVELNGEELLYQQYRLVFPPVAQGVVHRPSEHPLARPTTPRVHQSTPLPPGSAQTITLETLCEMPGQPSQSPVAAPGQTPVTAGGTPAAAPPTGAEEYVCGFRSRPMIPRTPD